MWAYVLFLAKRETLYMIATLLRDTAVPLLLPLEL